MVEQRFVFTTYRCAAAAMIGHDFIDVRVPAGAGRIAVPTYFSIGESMIIGSSPLSSVTAGLQNAPSAVGAKQIYESSDTPRL